MVIVLFLLLVVAAVCSWYSLRPMEVQLSDVAKAWQQSFSNSIGGRLEGKLRIEIMGELNAPARIYVDGTPTDLPSGKLNHFIQLAENWNSKCELRYEPLAVSSGNLRIRVMIGACIGCGYRRPIVGDPEPLAYNGGFTFYHLGSEQPHVEAGYSNGKRHGEWKYFDNAGQKFKVEGWQDGALVQGQK